MNLKKFFLALLLFVSYTLHAEVYAVIVGVSNYQNNTINNLQYAAADAQAFYTLLTTGKSNKSNIALLLDNQATKTNILQAMRKLFSKATANDHIIFYFSGHGNNGVFCQYDAGAYSSSMLQHSEVQALFKQSKAKVKLCFADACLAGSMRTSKNTKSAPIDTRSYYKVFEATPKAANQNIIVFLSSRADQYSTEFFSLKQGLFTYYLIKAFMGKADTNKDKKITATEMYNYVRRNVSDKTNGRQVPIMFGQFPKSTVVVTYK